jgi:hypothetical protein
LGLGLRVVLVPRLLLVRVIRVRVRVRIRVRVWVRIRVWVRVWIRVGVMVTGAAARPGD